MRTVNAHYRLGARSTLHPAYSMSEQKTSAQLGVPKAFTPGYVNKAQICDNEALHFAFSSLRENF